MGERKIEAAKEAARRSQKKVVGVPMKSRKTRRFGPVFGRVSFFREKFSLNIRAEDW